MKSDSGDNLCSKCAGECKQPKSVMLVSCPRYKCSARNLELFDSIGDISGDLTAKKRKSGKRKQNKNVCSDDYLK